MRQGNYWSRLVAKIVHCGIMLAVAASSAVAADEDKPQNLLQLDSAAIDHSTASKSEASQLSALTDGDSSTVVELTTAGNSHIDVVYAFNKSTIAPEKVTVELSPQQVETKAAPRIEILASSLSPHAGFQSVRKCMLKPVAGKQEFTFLPVGARWILIRIFPAAGADQASIAEISLLGRLGRPVTRYAFAEAPAKAFSVLSQLKHLVKVQITKDEASLFADAQDGKLDDWSFAEAALLASGVTDKARRKTYLDRLKKIETGARKAIEPGKTDYQRGELLLKYLHEQSLAAGYRALQTDLSVVLDEGTFNCVSSAVLYNVIGRRLGLDLRAIEVPDHAFSILYVDTKHADVETTNASGFNPSRDPAVQKQLLEQTGFRYIPEKHPEQRREVGEAGLAAIIYYNHGVSASKDKRYGEALFAYFRALSLDPEFSSAVKNVLSALANWSVELADAKSYEQALEVVNAGLKLAPRDATLINNRKAIWGERVEAAMDAGENDRALALLKEAHQQAPDGDFRAMQSWVYLRPAEQLIKQSQWEQALALADTGREKVEQDARQEIDDWRRGLYLRWSNAQLDQKQFAQAMQTLERGLAAVPDDRSMINNLGYVTQEWLNETLDAKGPQQAEAVLTALLKKHGDVDSVKNAGNDFVIRSVNQLRDDKQYSDALQMIAQYKSLLSNGDIAIKVTRNIIDSWAGDLIKQGKWQPALTVYDDALKQFPADSHLTHNLRVTWNMWAQQLMKAKKWSQAADVYAEAMGKHPDGEFEARLAYLTQEWSGAVFKDEGEQAAEKVLSDLVERFSTSEEVRDAAAGHLQRTALKRVKEKQYEQALKSVERSRKLFKDDPRWTKITHYVYDKWSDDFISADKWPEATDIYTKALKRYPKDSYFTKQAIATWNQWAGTYIDQKDWPKAIEVYEAGLKLHPDAGVLKNNLKYCQQQSKK